MNGDAGAHGRWTSSRTTGRAAFAGQTTTALDARAIATARRSPTPTRFWRHALHDGFIAEHVAVRWRPMRAAAAPAPAARRRSRRRRRPRPPTGWKIVFRPDPTILDGRFANNGWLQELPKPLSQGHLGQRRLHRRARRPRSSASRSRAPATTARTSSRSRYQGRTVRMPVWVLPGTADDVVVVHFGYGRDAGRPRRARASATNVFRLRHVGGAVVRRRRRGRARRATAYLIASTQNHFVMEGRNPVRVGRRRRTIAQNPKAVEPSSAPSGRPTTLSLYPALRVQRPQVGHVDRPERLHRLQRVHHRVRRREQHPGRRQGAGRPRPRDALDPRRHATSRASPDAPRHLPPAGAVPAVRERAVRGGLPGGGHGAQRRRPERHGLQPLRRHALLLEQLPVQGAALQLPALLGLRRRRSSRRSATRTSRSAAAASWRSAPTACSASTTRGSTPRRRAARFATARSRRPASRRARPTRSCSAT